MEKSTFHQHLTELKTAFPGKMKISANQAAKYYDSDIRTLLADRTVPFRQIGTGTQRVVHLIDFARWLAS